MVTTLILFLSNPTGFLSHASEAGDLRFLVLAPDFPSMKEIVYVLAHIFVSRENTEDALYKYIERCSSKY